MRFASCEKIGFYPIVNRAYLVEKLLSLGVQTVQIRIKDLKDKDLEDEIKNAIEISKNYENSQLFINDEWELALKYRAFGVHLGQEDIDSVSSDDFQQMADSGIRLGISTHNEIEIEKALKINPSYISIGPIFPTKSKNLPYKTHGIDGFAEMRKKIDVPVVALAGVTLENGEDLLKSGADGIAVMSDILSSENMDFRVSKWLSLFRKYSA
jgi:thiamine-phosphate diphosphorylase